jgi:hypothetical protein
MLRRHRRRIRRWNVHRWAVIYDDASMAEALVLGVDLPYDQADELARSLIAGSTRPDQVVHIIRMDAYAERRSEGDWW